MTDRWLEIAARLEGRPVLELAQELQRAYCDGLQDGLSANPLVMGEHQAERAN